MAHIQMICESFIQHTSFIGMDDTGRIERFEELNKKMVVLTNKVNNMIK
jgi:hypothetical protein